MSANGSAELPILAYNLLTTHLDRELTARFAEYRKAPLTLAPSLAQAYVERHCLYLLLLHRDTPKKRAAVSAFAAWMGELISDAEVN